MKVEAGRIIEDKKYCEMIFKYYLKIKIITKDNPTFFEKHLHKAITNLEFANFLLLEHDYSIKEKLPKNKYYDWCITIYYYSIYHASLALANKLGYNSKNHLATIVTVTLFYYHRKNMLDKDELNLLVEKMNLKREEIDLFLDSKDLREKACYGVDKSFEASQANKLQRRTVDFINKVRLLLEE